MTAENFQSISGELREPSEWTLLREGVHRAGKQELERRVKENPVPTDIELALGAFVEELEQPVREAIINLNKKGYSTQSSGFWGAGSDAQEIDINGDVEGNIGLDEKTCAKIRALGVEITKSRFRTQIKFNPQKPDAIEIKNKWDEIANLFPDRKQLPEPSNSVGSSDFREKYADPRRIRIMEIEYGLQAGYYEDRPAYKEQLRQEMSGLRQKIG